MTCKAFEDRLLNDLLPTFCNDPTREWGSAGFRRDWHKVHDEDAEDFLRGLDAGLVEHVERGLYRAARSCACEQLFFGGHKKIQPRPIFLWAEPIIAVAALVRLHFDFGWPKNLIGTQTPDWAFDVTAYQTHDAENEHIACEIKKSASELNQLVTLMKQFGKSSPSGEPHTPKQKNAYRKVQSLRLRRAPIFWALGPNEESRVFNVTYSEGGLVTFDETLKQELNYTNL